MYTMVSRIEIWTNLYSKMELYAYNTNFYAHVVDLFQTSQESNLSKDLSPLFRSSFPFSFDLLSSLPAAKRTLESMQL